jgi:hypothetical protein
MLCLQQNGPDFIQLFWSILNDRLDAIKALLQVFKAKSDVTARIAVNSVKCRRILHIKEMSFKNKSTENKLK